MDGYIGEIRLFAPNFAPQGWQFCQGQLLAINQNQALFAILGTFYGGNGQTNFALPNLAGKAAIGVGSSAGTSNYVQGEITGSATKTILISQLPAHSHTITGTISQAATSAAGTSPSPAGNYFASDGSKKYDLQNDGVTLQPASIGIALATAGGSQPVNNMMPYLALNYIICISGVFPSRN